MPCHDFAVMAGVRMTTIPYSANILDNNDICRYLQIIIRSIISSETGSIKKAYEIGFSYTIDHGLLNRPGL